MLSSSGLVLERDPHRNTERLADGGVVAGHVNEKQTEVDGEKKWLYAATDTESKLLLDVYSRHGTDPAAFTRARLSCSPSERDRF